MYTIRRIAKELGISTTNLRSQITDEFCRHCPILEVQCVSGEIKYQCKEGKNQHECIITRANKRIAAGRVSYKEIIEESCKTKNDIGSI